VASRPYGTGSYGTGRYGVGSGVNFEVAGQTQIAFSVTTKPSIIYAAGGATSITLLPQAAAARIWSPAGATQISFSAKWVNPQRIRPAAGRTQISFNVQGVLVRTWVELAPCEAGRWTQEYPPWTERAAA
jgi:hypothetical protein